MISPVFEVTSAVLMPEPPRPCTFVPDILVRLPLALAHNHEELRFVLRFECRNDFRRDYSIAASFHAHTLPPPAVKVICSSRAAHPGHRSGWTDLLRSLWKQCRPRRGRLPETSLSPLDTAAAASDRRTAFGGCSLLQIDGDDAGTAPGLQTLLQPRASRRPAQSQRRATEDVHRARRAFFGHRQYRRHFLVGGE